MRCLLPLLVFHVPIYAYILPHDVKITINLFITIYFNCHNNENRSQLLYFLLKLLLYHLTFINLSRTPGVRMNHFGEYDYRVILSNFQSIHTNKIYKIRKFSMNRMLQIKISSERTGIVHCKQTETLLNEGDFKRCIKAEGSY